VKLVTRCIIFLACIFLPTALLARGLTPDIANWQPGDNVSVPADWKVENALLFQREVDGRKVLGVRGQGEDSAFWRSPNLPLKPGGAYLFRFRAKGAGSGLIVSGPGLVNHDFGVPSDWKSLAFAFRVPEGAQDHYLRMGQWHLKGEIYFARPELYAVQVIDRRWGDLTLGRGEELRDGRYIDTHSLGWQGTTIHRTLYRQATYFNSDRWSFGASGEVIYRHDLPYTMRKGSLLLYVNFHTGGKLVVSASRDGQSWVPVAEADRVGQIEKPLPADLFPSKQVYIRMRGEGENASVQVNRYTFLADVDYKGAPRVGQSTIVEEQHISPGLKAVWDPMACGWCVRWQNAQNVPQKFSMVLSTDGKGKRIGTISLPGWGIRQVALKRPPLSAGTHTLALRAISGRTVVYDARMEVRNTVIQETGYGYPLSSVSLNLAVWWCESAWKVGRDRTPPEGKPRPAVRIEAARGEYEPAQVVLYAKKGDITLTGVAISDLVGKQGRIPASRVALYGVATVRIEHPSDYLGESGEYPDPLPPLKTPLRIRAGQNQAIWVQVHVPEKTPAGDYRSVIALKTSQGGVKVPLEVHVFDFTLPKQTHLRSGFGFDSGLMKSYHHLQTPEQERKIWDLYMQSFSRHRIAPYSFYAYGPIQVRFEGEGAAKRVIVDFSQFDREAERYLDQFGFSAFSLPIQGLGGGTFYERYEGEFGGFKAGTPEYERLFADYLRQIESHLKEKGWLEKAYVYWFDEPEPRDYPFVVEVMKRIRRYGPGIRRLLTEQPEAELIGHVEIWCGLTPEWTREKVEERRKAGEEVWWYICTGPKAPYIGLFMEHPAVEMRLWPWQSWQYGVQGILIWQTNYWTSSAAYPDKLQNPWEDPMSYVSGYGTPAGTKAFWGNGDGRFFYPPRQDPHKSSGPALDPPISSLRWENLRDGMEDYEYFWLLRERIRQLKGKVDASLMAQAEKLLEVPEAISKDLTTFTTDPRPLLEHRRKVAGMIERLKKK